MMEAQYKAHPKLTLKYPSTLGPEVGRGLFARENIGIDDENDGFLCHFFGMIILATPEQVRNLTKTLKSFQNSKLMMILIIRLHSC